MDASISVPEHVAFEVVDGEAVLLDLKSGVYFTLNPSGTRVWQLLVELGDLAEVRAAMLAEFAVRAETLEADVDALLSQLVEKGLVALGDR